MSDSRRLPPLSGPTAEVVRADASQDEVTIYRAAISRFSTGVAVITTSSAHGPIGMTASAVSSLSLEPLRLLTCIANHLFTRTAISQHGRFAVNVLGHSDEYLARHFARRQKDKFSTVEYGEDHGVPVLDRAIAHFVCDVAETLPGGDHTIFVGDVRHCDYVENSRPLVYFDTKFSTLMEPATYQPETPDWRVCPTPDLVMHW
jgi:3-hydroxy-9,10-secoandrosta-1,3,5(10)-triene-9,17-dione monooxygenase reductase component